MYRMFICLVGALVLVETAQALDVTSCGVTVPRGTSADLRTDLDCNGGFGVELSNGAKLRLNGHTLSTTTGVSTGALVQCAANACKVEGPGRITGDSLATGISVSRVGSVRGVTLDHLGDGVLGPVGSRLKVRDTSVDHVGSACVAGGVVRADDVTCTDAGGAGISGAHVRLKDVSVAGGMSHGVTADRKLRADRLTSTGNQHAGVRAERAVLKDSTVTGNGLSIFLYPGVDVLTNTRPQLVDTTCGASQQIGQPVPTPWGVCAND